MPTFLRYTTPTWLNAPTLPGLDAPSGLSYAYINVTSGGVGAGGSAPVSGVKSGGPNNGTFLFAFGDDVTASHLNRGLAALAANTDVLDDTLRISRALPQTLSVVLGAPGNVLNAGLGVYIYLGTPAAALNQTNLRSIMRVVDSNGDEILDAASKQRVEVTSISFAVTAPDPPWTDGTAFDFTLSHTLAAGTYGIIVGARSNMAIADRQALYTQYLSQDFHVSAALQEILSDMYGHTSKRPWTDTIPTTNIFLATRGLQGVLDNATDPLNVQSNAGWGWPTDATLDEYGAGSFWTRLRWTMAGVSTWNLTNRSWYGDGLQSVYAAYLRDHHIGAGTTYSPVGASRSFVSVGTHRGSTNAGAIASSSIAPALAHFVAYANFDDIFSDDTKAATKLALPSPVTLYNTASVQYVELDNATEWFWKTISSVKQTALVLERTLLEIEWTDPSSPGGSDTKRRTYVVTAIGATGDVVRVREVGGSVTSGGFPVSPVAGTLRRVLTPTAETLDGAQELREKLSIGSSLVVGVPRGVQWFTTLPASSTSASDAVARYGALYAGAAEDTNTSIAFQWGGYHRNLDDVDGGRYVTKGTLYGDGSASLTKVVVAEAVVGKQRSAASPHTLADTTDAPDLTVQLATTDLVNVAGPTGAACSITAMDITSALTTGDDGRTLHIIFKTGAYVAQMVDAAVWGANVLFESPADALLSGAVDTIDHFVGRVTLVGSTPYVLMSVRRYSY